VKAVSLRQLAEWSGGVLVSGNPAQTVTAVSKDTRSLSKGDLYVALRGENFDGNQFVADAAARGAAGAIVDDDVSAPSAGFPLIRVADGLAALQRIASAVRARLDLPVVCVTGSNGKTSTKDFTAAVLSGLGPVSRTQGNLNNHIGVPLSLLAINHEVAAVLEVGMNHAGEIAPLAALCRPRGAMITNIGVAHIEFLGSREAIAEEKGSLLEVIPADGFAVLNADDDFVDVLAARCRGKVIRVGLGAGDVTASDIVTDAGGVSFRVHAGGQSASTRIPVPGLHMVRNALFAVATGLELGLPLERCAEGLGASQLTSGRLQSRLIRGVRFLDDSYNANPDSMEAALLTLDAVAAGSRRIAVLGRMGELGAYAVAGYRRVGVRSAETTDLLIVVGAEAAELARAAKQSGAREVLEVSTNREAASLLRDRASEGDVILVKGSRSARMEQVIGEF